MSAEANRLLDEVIYNFIENKTYANAIAVLNELTEIDYKDLNFHGSEIQEEASELMKTLLDAVPLESMLLQHQIIILSLINNSPEYLVNIIVRYYFLPSIGNRNIVEVFCPHAEAVVVAVTRRVCGMLCNEAVSSFVARFIGLKSVQLDLTNQLNKTVNVADYRFRIFHVVVCVMQQTNFKEFEQIKFLLDPLIQEVLNRDHLFAITAVEMLTNIATARHESAVCLTENGAMQIVYKVMNYSIDNPDATTLFEVVIRLLGLLCRAQPSTLGCFPVFIRAIFNLTHTLDQLNLRSRVLGFETFAIMASGSEAKEMLDTPQYYPLVRKTMNNFAVTVSQSPDEIRVRMIIALSRLMSTSKGPQDSKILQKWFYELGAPFLRLMFAFLKQQNDSNNIRVEILRLLQAMLSCEREWAVDMLSPTMGVFEDFSLFEYLLERQETRSDYCHEKYEFFRRLVKPNAPNNLDKYVAESCLQYVRTGIFVSIRLRPYVEDGWELFSPQM